MDMENVRKFLSPSVDDAAAAASANALPTGFYDRFVLSGLRHDVIEPGRVVCSMTVPPRLVNSRGYLDGGVIATLVDVVSIAPFYSAGLQTSGVSLEISTSFVDAAFSDTCIIVFVEVPRLGKRIPLNVTPKDTIEDLLTMTGHPCSGMNLLIGNKKKKLLPKHDGGGGSCTLEECGIKDQDLILIVKAGSFMIHILIPRQETRTSREYFTKYVECLDTIGMVKSEIQDATGIRPEFQRLKYNGWWMDDDTNSLADYGIFDPEVDDYYVLVFPLLSPSGEDN